MKCGFIQWINLYTVDKISDSVLNFDWTLRKFYPLDRDLSAG